ncbi:hypothetical protein [Ferruginibacter sp. HRS2-29]|uniref:hypothetical protein n=1 Tax=Ferruginibacter sp. HRS2-29 TaxID=2487334 RepID=UPI0026E5974A|nr:hypothetical protein [Ferruginibacter sp. HRS2-29]MCP9753180.1 hypothetical protein [Ferruginibacter sp. HRS2-29]
MYLADKYALNTTKDSIQSIAFQLLAVIRPDIFSNYHRMAVYHRMAKEDKTKEYRFEDINIGPKKRDTLPGKLINRIKNIHFGIGVNFPLSMEEDIDCYLRDSDPESEIELWENMNASYFEFIDSQENVGENLKFEVASQLLHFSTYPKTKISSLTQEQFEELFKIWKSNSHLY